MWNASVQNEILFHTAFHIHIYMSIYVHIYGYIYISVGNIIKVCYA